MAWNQLCRKSYSQSYEDRFLEELVGERRDGFYPDIGCHHPIRLNNTYRLYRRGWSGVVVDASPMYEPEFARVRPRDTFVHSGVGDGTMGPIQFYQHTASALSTF